MDVSNTLDCTSIEEKDLVSRYVGRKLSPEEGEAFEEHYFGCDRCWEEVQAATEVRAALTAKEPTDAAALEVQARAIRRPWRNLAFLAAAAAVAIVAFGAGLLVSRSHRTSGLERIASVAVELPYSRLQARLAGPFEDLPPDNPLRGEKKSAAVKTAAEEVRDNPSSSTPHDTGVADLFLGEYNDAVKHLLEATRDPEADAVVWTALSAAYLARGSHVAASQASDFRAAVEAASIAVGKAPNSPAAAFNYARALRKAGMPQASEARRRYFQLEPQPRWKAKALEELSEVTRPTGSSVWKQRMPELHQMALEGKGGRVDEIVEMVPQFARLYVHDDLLPAWGELILAGDRAGADRLLRVAKDIGRALAERGDSIALDTVNAIENASSPRLRSAARGLRDYGIGRTLYRVPRTAEATEMFKAARDSLVSSRSPFQGQAELSLASCCIYSDQKRAVCAQAIRDLIREQRRNERRYSALWGQLEWVNGLAASMRGQPDKTLEAYHRSLSYFERLNEPESIGAVHSLLGSAYQYLGDQERACHHHSKALSLLGGEDDSDRLHEALGAAARAAREAHLTLVAKVLSDQQVTLAYQNGNPRRIADALLWRSYISEGAGRREQALEEIQRAVAFCDRIGRTPISMRLLSQLYIAEARLVRAADPSRAERALTLALKYVEATDNHVRTAEIYLQRGLIRLAVNRDLALEDFVSGVKEVEEQRGRAPLEQRISYFESSRELFDQVIALLVDRGELDRAFHYMERGRSRALLDLIGDSRRGSTNELQSDTVTVRKLSAFLPERTAILEYSVLSDRLLIWVARREGVQVVHVPAGVREIESIAQHISGLGERVPDPGKLKTLCRSLYELLIQPVETLLRGADALVFIPDKWLAAVPFPALVNGEGRHLIELHQVQISPSSTIYLATARKLMIGDQAPNAAVLVVGNPSIDKSLAGILPDLPLAAEESRRVESLYKVSVSLQGENATKRRFLSAAQNAEIIHFAGHAMVNNTDSALSALVLAPDRGDSDLGELHPQEISTMRLLRTRLVVLASCGSAAGQITRGEGVLSLARAFLAAGVPTVVAALWPVRDSDSAVLFASFYKHMIRGMNPSAALRNAQLELIHHDRSRRDDSSQWAAFQVFEGTSAN
jgi:CHAT domain-containing protein/tetratricopeptide (TPR) repeat protein